MTEVALPRRGDGSDTGGGSERVFLIADVRGYTRFTRERGDAEAARLASRFAELARDAVEARSGRVIELRGDEALAVFESASQAVRAAVELTAVCLDTATEDESLPLFVGVGIDLGEAVPVEGGFRGAALNMAARLCSQAAGGQVLVTTGIAERSGMLDGVRFEAAGSAELKGIEGSVELVEARRQERPRPPAKTGPAPPLPIDLEPDGPFVDREHELSWLRGTWRQVEQGYGRVLVMGGEAGIGKTRLAAELAAIAHASGAAVSYAGAGGLAAAAARSSLETAAAAETPTLLVLDDLDATAEAVVSLIEVLMPEIERRPALVLCLLRDAEGSAAVDGLLAAVNGRGDGHRRLAPLDVDGVRDIAALYAGAEVEDAPLESIARASGGVPARVHELMSGWAQQEATRRLSAAAEFLAGGRRRRSGDLDFANNVIGLKLERLYAADQAVELAAGEAPYKGLASFEESDAALFFGREHLVGELAARTVGAGLLAVVGASGSGKSSVIAAGLVPSLRAGLLPGSERWQTTIIRPGEHPSAELPPIHADERLVLVVDQFEEMFTLCTDEVEREAFVNRLLEIAFDPERAVVVLGLRGDFYGHCGAYPELAQLLAANQVLVGPMSPDELRRAIELPARRARVRAESVLTDALVEEIGDEPGGLPLLSTALVELWQAREDDWLRLATYERLGGVRSAVARLAERSYDNLTNEQRGAVRRLFLRLAAVGDEGAVVRRRVPLSELDVGHDRALAEVVERLTADRLLTAHERSVEVAHEALLREWPRFQEWLAEDAQGRELREHLTQSAKRWEAVDREPAELYRGARLSATVDWAAGRDEELNELERDFLGESRRHAEFEAERQRRQNRRLRILLVGLAVLLLAALGVGAFALVLRSAAQTSATNAEAQRLGSQALVQSDLDTSMLLAREGTALADSPATRGNLLAALLRSPSAIGIIRPLAGARLLQSTISPDGRHLLVSTNQGQLALVDTATRRVTQVLMASGLGEFSADGSRVAFFDTQGGVSSFDLATRKTTRLFAAPQPTTDLPTISPGLGLAAMGVAPAHVSREILVVRLPLGRVAARLELKHGLQDCAQWFSPDARYLAVTAARDCTNTSGSIGYVWRLGAHPTLIRSVPDAGTLAVSHNDKLVAAAGTDGSVSVLDLATGTRHSFNGRHNGFVDGVGFSPDDRTLVTTGDDYNVLVWDVATGQLRQTLTGHHGRTFGPNFSPDGKTLYTDSLDGSVIVWDLSGRRTLRRINTIGKGNLDSGPQQYVAASPDGRRLALTQRDGSVLLLDAHSLRPLRSLHAGGLPLVAAFSPDSRLVATETHLGGIQPSACRGRLIELWDAGSGRSLGRFAVPAEAESAGGPCADVESLAFSPDGKLLAGGYDTGEVFLWNTASRKPASAPLKAPPDPALSGPPSALGLAFSHDGKTLAVAAGTRATLWRLADSRPLYTVNVDDGFGRSKAVAFSPDGKVLATGGGTGVVKFWDAKSGRPAGRSILANACWVDSLQYSADGKVLLASGCDGAARLFDSASRNEIGTPLQGPPNVHNSAVLTADGNTLIVAYSDGHVYAWDVKPSDWKRAACSAAGRNLTRDEWQQFLPDRAYRAVCPGMAPG